MDDLELARAKADYERRLAALKRAHEEEVSHLKTVIVIILVIVGLFLYESNQSPSHSGDPDAEQCEMYHVC